MICQRSLPFPPAKPPRLQRLRAAAPPLLAALVLAACGGGGDDAAAPTERAQGASSCASRSNNNIEMLLECVTLAGVREHQAALQAIADANGGTRAAGTSGYDASLAYVKQRMEAAGYQVSLNAFAFVFTPPVLLQQLALVPATYESGSFTGAGFGDVTATVTPVDLQLGLNNASSSGCEAADFAGFPAGNIALVQRGSCSFAIKALNAVAAGAGAVIVFNQGNTVAPDRIDLIVGTLGGPNVVAIPVVGASYANGVALAQAGSTATVRVDPPQNVTQYNVIAESRDGDPNNVVMAGGHLDSVQRGPGINDNGSGSAVLLEVAEQMAKVKPRNKVRFAWWGAEESGLVGSTAYVAGLSEADRAKVALYLNFDMVGSPNHVFFVYDGDNSDGVGAGAGPEGSAAIEKTFENYYSERGIPFKGTDFSGRSDYGPFIAVGIPSGGLFTGAEGIKTAQEAATWGGTAGAQYDPCYHQACDTFANNNDYALDVNADAVAYATLKYAMTTADVNDEKSKGNFKKLVVPFPAPPAQ
jgi:Zn-dependent M28 family amino/carboxypeptidase